MAALGVWMWVSETRAPLRVSWVLTELCYAPALFPVSLSCVSLFSFVTKTRVSCSPPGQRVPGAPPHHWCFHDREVPGVPPYMLKMEGGPPSTLINCQSKTRTGSNLALGLIHLPWVQCSAAVLLAQLFVCLLCGGGQELYGGQVASVEGPGKVRLRVQPPFCFPRRLTQALQLLPGSAPQGKIFPDFLPRSNVLGFGNRFGNRGGSTPLSSASYPQGYGFASPPWQPM